MNVDAGSTRAYRWHQFGEFSSVYSLCCLRSSADIPTIAEAGLPGFESVQWYGLLAPAGTSRQIIAGLNKEATLVLRAPHINEHFAQHGGEIVASSPDEFAGDLKVQTEKMATLVKAAGIQPE